MRCRFLTQTSSELPSLGCIRTVFHHDLPFPNGKGPVDVHYYPPQSGRKPKSVIVFFPGNPGLISYYTPFLLRLQHLIHPSIALLSIAHLGHSVSLPHPNRPLTLLEQVEAKVEFVRCLAEECKEMQQEGEETEEVGRPEIMRIALMGHSVGAEICVQTMRRLEEDQTDPLTISALFLLFPTIANIAQSPNGRFMRPMFNFPLIRIIPTLSILLRPIITLLTYFTSPDSTHQSIYAPNATTLSFLSSPKTISHILHLAKSEMQSILDPDLEWYSQENLRRKIWSYWGENDSWVGHTGDEVKRILSQDGRTEEGQEVNEQSRLVNCVDNVPHAFCLAHSSKIATHVARWVIQAWPTEQASST